MLKRRQLLACTLLTPLLPLVSPLLAAPSTNGTAPRYLLLVELHGGNDSLNTFIPINDKAYYTHRPTLAVPSDAQVALTDTLAINAQMAVMEPIWAAGELVLFPGVGYPQPNRSHFRSIEIWDTASDSDQILENGWLAELYKGHSLVKHFSAQGIVIGRNAAPLVGNDLPVLVMNNQKQFIRQAEKLKEISEQSKNATLKHMLNTYQSARAGAQTLKQGVNDEMMMGGIDKKDKGKVAKIAEFKRDLNEAANIIKGGHGAPVIKVALSGFDTHINQKNQHDQLLKALAEGLAFFRQTMKEAGLWDQVLVMSYSEFGRRVTENGSQGTDHGTAATHFMMGGKVAGGVRTPMPSLSDLQNKDLKYTTDFRSLYASVAQQWLGIAPGPLLAGYPQLNIITL